MMGRSRQRLADKRAMKRIGVGLRPSLAGWTKLTESAKRDRGSHARITRIYSQTLALRAEERVEGWRRVVRSLARPVRIR